MKNIRKFETTAEMENAVLEDVRVSYVNENDKVYTTPENGGQGGVDENQYEYVDLGLPSGLKWATCNVGATKPEEYGLYFAWGETDGYTAEQVGVDRQFIWNEYKYGISFGVTKYNETDGKLVLELTDDAAHINMGGNWRMPTSVECQELIDNTTSAWTTVNGVQGMKFTSKSDTSKSIFVPAGGDCGYGNVIGAGDLGSLWSSSLTIDVTVARRLDISPGSPGSAYVGEFDRYSGRSVRGVLE